MTSYYGENVSNLNLGKFGVFKYFVIFFILIWSLKIWFIDFTVLIIIFGMFLLLTSSEIRINKKINLLFFCIYFLLIYSLILIVFKTEGETSFFYPIKYLRVLISYFFIYAIIYYFFNENKIFDQGQVRKVIFALGYVLLLQPIFMVLQLVSLDFYYFMLGFMPTTGAFNGFRARGLMTGTSSGGQFLGYISIYFAFIAVKYNSKFFLLIFIGLLPLFPLSAIAGLVPYLFAFLYLIIYRFNLKRLVFILFLIFTFLVAVFTIFNQSENFQKGFTRILILIGDDEQHLSKSHPINSFNSLIRSIDLPDDGFQLLFGNAQPSKSTHATTNTDSGYFTNIHAFGLLGTLFLLFTISLFYFLTKSNFFLIFLVSYLIVFFKNDMSFGRIVFNYVFVIFSLFIINKNFRWFFR